MGPVILVIVLVLPIAEIAGFVVIGGRIGVLATLAWVILAAALGLGILRLQGMATAFQLRAALSRDEVPGRALFDGACVALAGLLLIFPGFVSDALAVPLLLPPLRGALFRLIARQVDTHLRGNMGGAAAAARGRGVVIEGEYHEIDPDGPEDTPERRRLGAGDPDSPKQP